MVNPSSYSSRLISRTISTSRLRYSRWPLPPLCGFNCGNSVSQNRSTYAGRLHRRRNIPNSKIQFVWDGDRRLHGLHLASGGLRLCHQTPQFPRQRCINVSPLKREQNSFSCAGCAALQVESLQSPAPIDGRNRRPYPKYKLSQANCAAPIFLPPTKKFTTENLALDFLFQSHRSLGIISLRRVDPLRVSRFVSEDMFSGGNSRTVAGPAARPAARFIHWPGSSGRPAFSRSAGNCCSKLGPAAGRRGSRDQARIFSPGLRRRLLNPGLRRGRSRRMKRDDHRRPLRGNRH